MAEQQIPLNQEELNQEQFKPNVADILGYNKDVFKKDELSGDILEINPTQPANVLDDSMMNWMQRDAAANLNSMSETLSEKVKLDKNGNIDYSSNTGDDVAIMMGQKFDDPEFEDKRVGIIDDIKTRRDKEIEESNALVDSRVASGELKAKRGERLKEKNKKEIDKRYSKEAGDRYIELYDEVNPGNNGIPRNIKRKLRDYEKGLDLLYKMSVQLGAGNPVSMEDMIAISSDPEYHKRYLEVKDRGILTFSKFKEEYLSGGNVNEGDVYLAYVSFGNHITTEPIIQTNYYGDTTNYSRPVYFTATKDKDGNKIVNGATPAFVHPVTDEIIGGYVPPKYGTSIEINADYAALVGYKDVVDDIEKRYAANEITLEERNKQLKSRKEAYSIALKKNMEAYESLMSNTGISNDMKLAIVASTYPNEFEEKYSEFLEKNKPNSFIDNVAEWTAGLTSKYVSSLSGGVATGIDEFIQWYLEKPDVEFPMGVLALEMSRNPELVTEMQKLIEEAGTGKSKYLSSINGIYELTKSARMRVRDRQLDAAATYGKQLLNTMYPLIKEFDDMYKSVEIEYNNYNNGLRSIYNDSGYATGLETANKLLSDISNNNDINVRNAYRFITLKQKVLNYEGAGSGLSMLSDDDLNFINTTGAELAKSNPELINNVIKRLNEVAGAYKLARSLYPAKEIQEYEKKNKQKLDASLLSYNQSRDAIMNSEIFSPRSTQALDLIQNIYNQFGTEDNVAETFFFPMLSMKDNFSGAGFVKLITADGAAAAGLSILSGISDIFRGIETTFNVAGAIDFDLNKVYLSASMNEYKRHLESSIPKTGHYATDLAAQVGSALPQMVAFVGSSVLGGPAGGAAYLGVTMTGEKMREAADAGCDPVQQMLFAGLSVGIEYASELITSEAGLVGVRGGKSVLTKSLLNRIMNVGTRKEALKEYARLIWKTGKNVVKSGTLESFEEQVADKANFILQNMFNKTLGASFDPSIMGFQESFDNLLVMTATGALFKGGTYVFNKQKPIEGKLKKEFEQEYGMSSYDATFFAAFTSMQGLKIGVDFVRAVEDGSISSNSLDMEKYDYLKNKIIPAAMMLQSDILNLSKSNVSIQQRAVALYNMMQINEVNGKVESGEIAAGSAETVVAQLTENANKALADKKFADEQFGLDDTGLAQSIKQYMGIYDIATNEDGLLDASIRDTAIQEGQPITTGAQPAVAVGGAVQAETGAVVQGETEGAISEPSALDKNILQAENDAIIASDDSSTANPSQLTDNAAAAVRGQAVSEMGTTPVIPTTETIPARVQQAAQEQGFDIVTRTGLAEKLISLVAAPISKNRARRAKEKMINSNPEKAILMEIYNTRALIDIAQDRYEGTLRIRPTAGMQLGDVRKLTDRLNKLIALKDNYSKTQQYATEISQGLQQEIAQRGGVVQYQGAQEGQLEEGERERRERQDAQSAADYRNSNFGSQAQQAAQEIAEMPERSPILQNYIGSMQPGQEVQLMDEIAAQVVTNEPAAVRQFGQQVVDRTKQYIADTNFTTDLPVVKQAMVREAEQRVSLAEQEANTVIARQNQNTSKQHNKAVVKLVDRLKQAFPNVKVFMDRNGFEAAIQDPAARELMTKGGIVYGRILNGDVYLNPDFSNYNTPIHEFGHLWLNVAKEIAPNTYNRGLELIRDSEYVKNLDKDPLYNGLTKEELEEEALATAIGDKGEQLVFESQRKGFRGWMSRLLRKMAQFVGIMNMSSSELRRLDLDTYLNMVNASLLAGEPLTVNRMDVTEIFMAKMDNDVKNALTRVAQDYFNSAIARGLDLEAARINALDRTVGFIKLTYQKKSNIEDIINGVVDIVLNVSEAERLRIIEKKKTEKLNKLFRFSEFQAIATMANQEADTLAQGKVKASEATTSITEKVREKIEELFNKNKAPEGVSWLDAMGLAPSIAADAVMAAYPNTNRSSLVNEDIVTMTTSAYMRNAIFNQIRAIKDVQKRAEAIRGVVKDIFKQMAATYGKGLELSAAKVNAILAEVESNVFSRDDVMSAITEAANAVSNIIENEYRGLLIDKGVSLINKVSAKADKATYTSDFKTKAAILKNLNINDWKNSNATLEDISEFNSIIGKILKGDLSKFDDAIQMAGRIQVDNDARIVNEYDGLIGKINRMIAKAGNLDMSDYGALVAFSDALQDIESRKEKGEELVGILSPFTTEQLDNLNAKIQQLKLSFPGGLTIEQIIAQKETEITDATHRKAMLLSGLLQDEASDMRMKIKNPLNYHRAILFSKFILKDDYIDSLSAREKLALIDSLDNLMTYGNYNFDVHKQDIKARAYFLKTNTIEWAVKLAQQRRALSSPGLTGIVINKFKNFARVFTDVEGTTPSAELIAENFDLLRLHSMDVELFNGKGKTGYDIFDMGFLEREIFAPMASSIDGAVNKTQARLENLQNAMILLGDKSNRAVIKRAIRGMREQYGTAGSITLRRILSTFKRGSNENLYVDISTRMAAIIAHQIDHISNLKEGQVADDMILKRNILDGMSEEAKSKAKTMSDAYGKLGDIGTLSYEKLLDAIAYSALTNNGTETLAEKSQEDLLKKLTATQRDALASWREFINANKDLAESAMVVRGNMKSLIKNYFPRILSASESVTDIKDAQSYINSQHDNIGLSSNQIMGRKGDTGRLMLNGNKVLLNNLKSLHLLNEMQPYINYIKGVSAAVKELKDLAGKETNEEKKREYAFAAAYAEGVEITITRRLNNSLLNGDKSVNSNFTFLFRLISKTQKFAANRWLINVGRQLLSDYPANIEKSAASLSFANRNFKTQTWRLLSPSKSAVRTSKGKFVWEDYVAIAELTGSPVYRTVSIYSDNFLYDYSKTSKQLQRQQKIVSWQDMAVKKQVWMERFENAFKRLTNEDFDHVAFRDERGAYRAMMLESVEMASKAADSTVDRQFGLPSFARQPLKVNIAVPFLGRPLRYVLQSSPKLRNFLTGTISKNNVATTITGFMMNYPSTQYSLFRNYMKLGFSGTSGLSIKKRSKYIAQAITEAYAPTMIYGLSRTLMGWAMASAAQVIYATAGSDEEKEKALKELEGKEWWEKQLIKFKMQMQESEDQIIGNLLNSLSSNVVDPQQTYFIRMAAGFTLFQLWKKNALVEMDKNRPEKGAKLSKEESQRYKDEREAMGRAIKKEESWWWHLFNIKPLEIYGGQEYEDAVRKYDIGWVVGSPTRGWEQLFESIGGFSEVHKTVSSLMTTYELWEALEKGEGNINQRDLLLASLMQAYGLIFSNFILGGNFAWASLISGDATKLGNAITKDLELENEEFIKKTEEEEEKRDKMNRPKAGAKGTFGDYGENMTQFGKQRKKKTPYNQ